jgi:hypothetical protein
VAFWIILRGSEPAWLLQWISIIAVTISGITCSTPGVEHDVNFSGVSSVGYALRGNKGSVPVLQSSSGSVAGGDRGA